MYLDEGKLREIAVDSVLKLRWVKRMPRKINPDVRVGHVELVIVGWKGAGERKPPWELRQ